MILLNVVVRFVALRFAFSRTKSGHLAHNWPNPIFSACLPYQQRGGGVDHSFWSSRSTVLQIRYPDPRLIYEFLPCVRFLDPRVTGIRHTVSAMVAGNTCLRYLHLLWINPRISGSQHFHTYITRKYRCVSFLKLYPYRLVSPCPVDDHPYNSFPLTNRRAYNVHHFTLALRKLDSIVLLFLTMYKIRTQSKPFILPNIYACLSLILIDKQNGFLFHWSCILLYVWLLLLNKNN